MPKGLVTALPAQNSQPALAAAAVALIISIPLGVQPMSALGVALFAYCSVWYFRALGREIAVIPLSAFIASAQWIVGPLISYRTGEIFDKYRMYVDEATYMNFVVPALFAFIIPLHAFAPKISIDRLRSALEKRSPIPDFVVYGLIIFGLLLDLFSSSASNSIGFFIFLAAKIKYIAAIYLITNRRKWRWAIAGGVLFFSATTSAQEGLFHDLILWSAFVMTFFFHDFRLDFLKKISIVILGIITLAGIQLVKADYRDRITNDPGAAGLVTLGAAVGEALLDPQSTNKLGDANVRLNQGWIISAVMANTPAYMPYVKGETVINAVRDSILPRFLFAKREVNQSDSFRRFTGLPVGGGTSFGISIVGEAWANFGYYGIGLMFAWGAALASMIRYIHHRSILQPTFALWTPLIMLHAVKAETELVVALNHMTKAGIFVWLIYALAPRALKQRL